jgi:two-component system, cell cycle sensor histidine kinase and response regulator CckA
MENVRTRPSTRTILVVDDDPVVRNLVARALERIGYFVCEAESGELALELLARRTPAVDLVLTDIMMPQLSGLDLARLVAERWPELRLVFMSGGIVPSATQRPSDVPEVPCLRKPFTSQQLAEWVRSALDR